MDSYSIEFRGFTPYLHYDNIESMIDWLTRVFGFKEKGRWVDENGIVRNAELTVGSDEVWLDGYPNWWKERGRKPEEWIGVWVEKVDNIFARVSAAGIEAKAPANRFFGVRVFQVTDPEGYTWGFMERAPYVARQP